MGWPKFFPFLALLTDACEPRLFYLIHNSKIGFSEFCLSASSFWTGNQLILLSILASNLILFIIGIGFVTEFYKFSLSSFDACMKAKLGSFYSYPLLLYFLCSNYCTTSGFPANKILRIFIRINCFIYSILPSLSHQSFCLGNFSWFHLFYVVNISLYHDFPILIGTRRLSSFYLLFQIDQTLFVLVVRLWSIFEDSQFGCTRYYWLLKIGH